VEGHSSRLEQVEDRISEFKYKIDIKEKTEELLVKQLKSCERNIQELSDSIKRPNLRIIGIEEGKEMQAKGILNIFKNNNREFPKSQESLAHSGTGVLQDAKET
jgi:chromosome segregation ATPase